MTHDHRTRRRALTGAPALPALLALVPLAAGCGGNGPDAYGNFESREVTVSAEETGTLVRFDVEEGDALIRDAVVGQIDTVTLALQRDELEVQARVAATRVDEARAQLRALEAQLRTARDDLERAQRLYQSQVATATELNRLEGSVSALEAQVAAGRVRVRLAGEEREAIQVRTAQVADRIRRATVVNPARGTVLTTFVEAGEFVQTGRPLYTVAPLDTLILRAYLSGSQLGAVRVGGEVTVQFDGPDGALVQRPGTLSWISPVAEFTPTPIQTREERVDQVYAIKIQVPNPDGALKIGMPGEVLLASAGTEGSGG